MSLGQDDEAYLRNEGQKETVISVRGIPLDSRIKYVDQEVTKAIKHGFDGEIVTEGMRVILRERG